MRYEVASINSDNNSKKMRYYVIPIYYFKISKVSTIQVPQYKVLKIKNISYIIPILRYYKTLK